jgi:hypothetical protein
MHVDALVQMIVSAAGHGSPPALVPGLVLLVFCGLLRPLEPRVRAFAASRRTAGGGGYGGASEVRGRAAHESGARGRGVRSDRQPDARADRVGTSAIDLNSIELALLAELSLEMALGEDAVANDVARSPQTRRVASELAAAWRERSRRFQLQAQRQGMDPIVPELQPERRGTDPIAADLRLISGPAPSYRGPERRKRMRRTQTRRTSSTAPDGIDRLDRRTGRDRRQHDRRRRELAPR